MFNLRAANLHDGNAHDIALLVAAAASGAFDLSVTLRHVLVSHRYRLTAKNRCIGIGRKWRARSNTNENYFSEKNFSLTVLKNDENFKNKTHINASIS